MKEGKNMTIVSPEKDRGPWWKSLKKGDKLVKVTFPGDPDYEKELKKLKKKK
jgi:hypothetical protein